MYQPTKPGLKSHQMGSARIYIFTELAVRNSEWSLQIHPQSSVLYIKECLSTLIISYKSSFNLNKYLKTQARHSAFIPKYPVK